MFLKMPTKSKINITPKAENKTAINQADVCPIRNPIMVAAIAVKTAPKIKFCCFLLNLATFNFLSCELITLIIVKIIGMSFYFHKGDVVFFHLDEEIFPKVNVFDVLF